MYISDPRSVHTQRPLSMCMCVGMCLHLQSHTRFKTHTNACTCTGHVPHTCCLSGPTVGTSCSLTPGEAEQHFSAPSWFSSPETNLAEATGHM